MSETTAAAPVAATAVAITAPNAPGLFASWIAAAEHGAALGYNEVVKIEADVSQWTAAHPKIEPVLQAGIDCATAMLAEAGLPVPAMISGGTAILAAWKKFAALDATVDSGH